MRSHGGRSRRNVGARSRWHLSVAFVAVAALTAACGSTIQPSRGTGDVAFNGEDGGLTTGAEDAELSLDTVDPLDAFGPEDTAFGNTAPGRAAIGDAHPGPDEGQDPAPSGVTPPGGSAQPPGQTVAATGDIPIGVLYADDGQAALAAFGASATRGDERAEYETLIEDVNARGGIHGRWLTPLYYMTPFRSTTPDSDLQAACAHFTQDNEVVAVLTSRAGGSNESFKRCLEEAGVVHIQANFSFAGDATYARNSLYVEPTNFSLDRSAAHYVPALMRQEYFTGWNAVAGQPAPGEATVGIVTWDTPTHETAVGKVLVPRLQNAGVTVREIARVNAAEGAGVQAQEVANAVLRFRQRGVGHVIFFSGGGDLPLLFVNQAGSQGYRPRYAFTSQELPSLLLELGVISDPDRNLNGAVGMGWWPSADLPLGRDPFADRPQSQRCLEVLAADGHEHNTALARTLALIHCDVVDFLEQSLKAAGPGLTRADFREGLNRLGSSFAPRFTIATAVSAQRRDGAAAVNDWQYQRSCSCFQYVGQPREAR